MFGIVSLSTTSQAAIRMPTSHPYEGLAPSPPLPPGLGEDMTSLPPTPGLDEDMSGVPLTKRSTDWPLGGHSAEPSRRMVNEVGFEEQGGFDDGVGGAKGLRLEEMQREDLVLKKRLRLLKFVLRAATLVLAIYMTATMSITIHKYLSTRHHMVRTPPSNKLRNAWSKETTVWTTILLLTTSFITVVFNLVIVIAYIRSVGAANVVQDWAGYAGFAIFGTHMGMWIATAVLYRTGKTGKDLWGWSCSDKAMAIQPDFEGIVDFAKYCRLQTGSWGTGIAQASVSILSVVVYYVGYLRLKHKRTMAQLHGVEMKESRLSKHVPTKINTEKPEKKSRALRLLRLKR